MNSPIRPVNRIRSRIDASFLSEKVLAFPTKYFFGVSMACDIHCPYCPRQYYTDEVKSGFMDYDDFLKILPWLEYADEAFLFGLGEPFLHPRFFDFLKAAKETGVRVGTSSHGMSLDPETIRRIVEIGLDELAVSIDGANRETFETLRAGAGFDTVKDNIQNLQEIKKQKGADKPEVHVAMAVSSHNVRQMTGVVKLAGKLGATRVVFTDLILVNPENASLSVSKTDLFWDQFHKAKRAAGRLGIQVLYFYQYPFPWKKEPAVARIRKGKHYFCTDPWRLAIIDRFGEMKPCCYYPPNVGNVFQTSLDRVINGKESLHLRKSLLEGNVPECCINCGMLSELTAEESRKALDEAARLLDDAANKEQISSQDEKDLRNILSEYRLKWKQMFPNAADPWKEQA